MKKNISFLRVFFVIATLWAIITYYSFSINQGFGGPIHNFGHPLTFYSYGGCSGLNDAHCVRINYPNLLLDIATLLLASTIIQKTWNLSVKKKAGEV